MKITHLLLVTAAAACLFACTESTETTTETVTTDTEATTAQTATEAAGEVAGSASAAAPASEATDVPDAASAAPAGELMDPSGTTFTGITDKPMAKSGLNPAHGAPGHDCAIPVGAPLGSKPGGGDMGKVTTTAPTPTPAPTPIQPNLGTPPAGGAVAAGMNPAHGQPGHDCAIPVGAPLKK